MRYEGPVDTEHVKDVVRDEFEFPMCYGLELSLGDLAFGISLNRFRTEPRWVLVIGIGRLYSWSF